MTIGARFARRWQAIASLAPAEDGWRGEPKRL